MLKIDLLKNNHKFFKAANVLLILAVAAIVGIVGWHFYQERNKNNALSSKVAEQNLPKNIQVKDSTDGKFSQLDTNGIAKLQASAPVSSPTIPSTIPPKAPVSTPANSKPQPVPHTFVSISSDGCQVTASGAAGQIFEVDVYTPTKGGSMSYTLPASGKLIKASGGIKDMTVYAQISTASGTKITYSVGKITADSCPPAG